jgi:hypothetical protein
MCYVVENHRHEKLRVKLETWAAIPVDTLATAVRLLVHSVHVDTLNTYSSSTCVADIPSCVYEIWIINQLFKQIFCKLKCEYIFGPLSINKYFLQINYLFHFSSVAA